MNYIYFGDIVLNPGYRPLIQKRLEGANRG